MSLSLLHNQYASGKRSLDENMPTHLSLHGFYCSKNTAGVGKLSGKRANETLRIVKVIYCLSHCLCAWNTPVDWVCVRSNYPNPIDIKMESEVVTVEQGE